MSEQSKNEKAPRASRPARGFDNQSDRWLKYGSNVALTIVLAAGAMVFAIWISDRYSGIEGVTTKQMTSSGSTLTPQTVTVLNDLKGRVTLVSLYHVEHDQGASETDRLEREAAERDKAKQVTDLLAEYKKGSGNIDVMIIDPVEEKQKLELLHNEFITRYGAQIKNYRDYLDEWRRQFEQLKKLTDDEAKLVSKFASSEPGSDSAGSFLAEFVSTITSELPEQLERSRKAVDHELKKKHPDYKTAATIAKQQMQTVSELTGSIVEQAPKISGARNLPQEFRTYLTAAVPRYDTMKKIADDLVAKGDGLKEMKIDELEAALNVVDPILVLGADDWRILPQSQIWPEDNDIRAINASAKTTQRFAGEQQITAAIYTLENPKPRKVCFVRGGGPPLTQPGFPPFVPGGPLSGVAERLKEYNFQVLEKDLSGTWAMQAQMRQQQGGPEPSDEEIKDAIWIVVDTPVDEQQSMGAPPAQIGAKLKEHLAHGGSALVLGEIGGNALADALKDWGIELHPQAVAVHEAIKPTETEATLDPLEEAKARQFFWDCRSYGDQLLAKPLTNLDSLFFAPIVVSTNTPAAGCTVTPFLPLSENMPGMKTWGETYLAGLDKGNVDFHDKASGPPTGAPKETEPDIAGPVFAGAIAEKSNGGRLVVIGSVRSFSTGILRILDQRAARRDPPRHINRFPGNGELFSNSIFWLAHLEPMISISPSGLAANNINVTPASRMRWGLTILFLLPALAIACGIGVYFKRRD